MVQGANNTALMDLPGDWWRSRATCEVLARWFIEYLLGLFISYETAIDGRIHHEMYTGFLLYHRDALLWVTAGHVVDRVNDILSDSSKEVIRMRWLDGCKIPGAESVPVNQQDIITFSAYEIGIDFGLINIHGIIAQNILSGDQVKIMDEKVWMGQDQAQPEGYYIFGYPEEWKEIEEGRLPDNRMWGAIQANLAGLPVRRIEYQDRAPVQKPAPFWDNPEGFFGEILPFVDADAPIYQPQDIDWMSGAPLLSVERTPDGIRCWLFGIQSRWVCKHRQIRAEPIHKIIQILNSPIDET